MLRIAAITAALLLLLALPAAAADLITLENGAIRIEIDPAIFSVRFVGFPGGKNFLEPNHIDARDRAGAAWLDPGGLTTDLVPLEEKHAKDPALRRGPAEVIEADKEHVVLLGKPSEALGVRLKKEIRLDGAAPRAFLVVTALSDRADGPETSLRNSVRVPARSTVRVPKRSGTFAPLQDKAKAPWAIVNSKEFWLVPIPPTAATSGVVLGGFAPETQIQNDSGVWSRRLTLPPVDPLRVWNATSVLCVLDDPTRSYGLSLQGALGFLTAATPLQLTEEWTFEKRGR